MKSLSLQNLQDFEKEASVLVYVSQIMIYNRHILSFWSLRRLFVSNETLHCIPPSLHPTSYIRALSHPNVVQFHGIYCEERNENTLYMVCEYMAGGSVLSALTKMEAQLHTNNSNNKNKIALDMLNM